MAESIQLIVVTPQRRVLDTAAEWVDVPAASGAMRVLPGHAPTLGELGEGEVRYQDAAGATHGIQVGGGFLEVLGERVTLLADSALADSAKA
ncbi:MAG TPA: hypothetical protein VIC54_07095 [Terriglobales bacterium]|jgi:F-type H+-transporting ATPase subunit epsilon